MKNRLALFIITLVALTASFPLPIQAQDSSATDADHQVIAKAYAKNLKRYIKQAEAGDVEVMRNLGLMYLYSYEIKPDIDKAMYWFNKASDSCDVSSELILASLYLNGEKVDKDTPKAIEYLRKAAMQDHTQAQIALGVMYENGEGVKADKSKAAKWYKKAAEQGHAAGKEGLNRLESK